MFVAIIVILIFTSLMLTQWIHKGVFEPINELNVAMRKIKEGNFDYVLETDAKVRSVISTAIMRICVLAEESRKRTPLT